ncbi:MAG: DUF84 family protein [bacterium]
MVKIAVGTTSKAKLRILDCILLEADIKADITSFDVASGVTHQPRTEKETKQGSINRATNALKLCEDSDIGLGIEVGYEPIDGILYMHGVTSIIDQAGNIYSEQSSILELPKYFHKYLHDHEDDGVGFHVNDYKNLSDDKSWKYFAEIIQYREPFIRESARNALLRYIFRGEY